MQQKRHVLLSIMHRLRFLLTCWKRVKIFLPAKVITESFSKVWYANALICFIIYIFHSSLDLFFIWNLSAHKSYNLCIYTSFIRLLYAYIWIGYVHSQISIAYQIKQIYRFSFVHTTKVSSTTEPQVLFFFF